MSLYRKILRPLLFRFDPERVHHGSVEACYWLGAVPGVPTLARAFLDSHAPSLQQEIAGLHFRHPIGLAAGWDKNGRALRMLEALGFSFAEIGSISARPSQGNPPPRLFRLPQDSAIIVNYGLPNDGAESVAARLRPHRAIRPLGINVVKTNDGTNAKACDEEEIFADYAWSVRQLQPHASYLMLNLSCPNAVGGRDFFSQPGKISQLLERLKPIQIHCPVFLKIAPKEDPGEHERVLMECEAHPWVRGFCFNLPQGKPDSLQFTTPRSSFAHQEGAVSGRPVEGLINRCIASFYARMDRQRYVLIGTGGVFDAEDAYRKIRLGASLVQLYTALIYEGPGVTKRICRGLTELLKRDGFATVSEAIGTNPIAPQ